MFLKIQDHENAVYSGDNGRSKFSPSWLLTAFPFGIVQGLWMFVELGPVVYSALIVKRVMLSSVQSAAVSAHCVACGFLTLAEVLFFMMLHPQKPKKEPYFDDSVVSYSHNLKCWVASCLLLTIVLVTMAQLAVLNEFIGQYTRRRGFKHPFPVVKSYVGWEIEKTKNCIHVSPVVREDQLESERQRKSYKYSYASFVFGDIYIYEGDTSETIEHHELQEEL